MCVALTSSLDRFTDLDRLITLEASTIEPGKERQVLRLFAVRCKATRKRCKLARVTFLVAHKWYRLHTQCAFVNILSMQLRACDM